MVEREQLLRLLPAEWPDLTPQAILDDQRQLAVILRRLHGKPRADGCIAPGDRAMIGQVDDHIVVGKWDNRFHQPLCAGAFVRRNRDFAHDTGSCSGG